MCGQFIDPLAVLENEKRTRDHLPPAAFFPKSLRKQGVFQNLDTLPTHYGCNNTHKEDEEYVARAMALFVGDQTSMGNALLQEFVNQLKKEPGKASVTGGIMDSVSEKHPSGISVPPSKLVVQVDALKLQNVMWKIARGIFFKHFDSVLPEDKDFYIQYYPPPDVQLPEQVEKFLGLSPTVRTSNPKVFIYKYGLFNQQGIIAHLMFFFFWDCFIVYILFHAFECKCEDCLSNDAVKVARGKLISVIKMISNKNKTCKMGPTFQER